jgi:hypothetical protein
MQRLVPALSAIAALSVAACGEVDMEKAGRNAALAALEASNPEIVQGIRAAQTLREAAATCGWQDVDATRLAQAAVAGIETPPLRAAAESLVEDLIVAPSAASTPAAGTPVNDCSPEVRQALEAQIAAIAGGEGEGETESEAG